VTLPSIAGRHAREPDRDVPRRLGADDLGEVRQPVGHGCRIVVDDVVDTRCAAFDSGDRGRGRVFDVDPRPDRGPRADDRHLPRADELDQGLGRARPVEAPVAEHDAFERRVEHRTLEIADRRQRLRLLGRRIRVERVILGLDRAALADVRPAGVALDDEAPRAGGLRCGEQGVGALRAKLVRDRELLVEAAEVAHVRERAHLVDDHVRLGACNDLPDLERVEAVHHDRLGAQCAQLFELLLASGRGNHLVAPLHQLRHEPPSDRTACSCDEDSHECSFPSCSSLRRESRGACDS
jgi:hypothetical protein